MIPNLLIVIKIVLLDSGLWHGVMQGCGYAGLRLCGYETKGYRKYGFVVLTVQHLAEVLLFSHPMLVGIGYRFHGFFHTLCHYEYGSLRIVEAAVLWIMEDHGMVLEGWRSVLSAAVFGCLEIIS